MDQDDQKVGGLLADRLHISRPSLTVLLSPPNQSLDLEVSNHMHYQHSQNQWGLAEPTGIHHQACKMVSVSAIVIAANDHPTA